jgi:hypothetical protein
MPESEEDKSKIMFYDRRVRKIIKRHQLGYNGFVKLNVNGAKLTAEYRDLEDTCVIEEQWQVNLQNGQFGWNIVSTLADS